MADAIPTKHFIRSALTGGIAGCMDAVDGALLAEGYTCAVITPAGVKYDYRLNATSGAAESSPGIITPDTNAGNKRWILVAAFDQSLLTTASPTFATIKTTNLTDGYIPKHTSDAVGLANSPIYTDGTNVGIGTTAPGQRLTVDAAAGSPATTGTTQNGIFRVGTIASTIGNVLDVGKYLAAPYGMWMQATNSTDLLQAYPIILQPNSGNVGIGMTGPNYKLEISTDSAGKPGAGGLWTVVSDERIKKDITLADLDRCYEIIKTTPLKRFTWADGVYSDEQVKDKNNIGWIAQDVQKVFPKATNIVPFTKAAKIDDGIEEYEEQDFTVEEVEKEETSIEIREGKPVQITKIVKSEVKTMLFDDVHVMNEFDQPVMKSVDAETYEPLTHKVPRMVKKTRPKFRQEIIEDCLDLNGGQMIAAMYGALQKSMSLIADLQARIQVLEK